MLKFSKMEFLAYFHSAPPRSTHPQKNETEIISVRKESHFPQKVSDTLFNTAVYGSNETHIITHNLKMNKAVLEPQNLPDFTIAWFLTPFLLRSYVALLECNYVQAP